METDRYIEIGAGVIIESIDGTEAGLRRLLLQSYLRTGWIEVTGAEMDFPSVK
jgi:hypothetical protein